MLIIVGLLILTGSYKQAVKILGTIFPLSALGYFSFCERKMTLDNAAIGASDNFCQQTS